jgi:hypothetical protein
MNKPALSIVAKPAIPTPFDDAKGKKLIEANRARLLAASVKYIREGKDGSFPERVITASNLSGIPRALLDAEAKR